MEDKIQALGIELNNCTEKEAMRLFVDASEGGAPTLIDLISAEDLMLLEQSTRLNDYMSEFDLVVPTEAVILQEAGITDSRRIKQVDQRAFLRMALRYLRKHNKRVFLVSAGGSEEEKVLDYLEKEQSGIRICGTAAVEQDTTNYDGIVNALNGQEPDCVIAVLTSPQLEEFMLKSKYKMNVPVCLGMGSSTMVKTGTVGERFAKFTLKKLFQKRTKETRV